jgi:hypothetical protein
MPEVAELQAAASSEKLASGSSHSQFSAHFQSHTFNNEWLDSFANKTTPPAESKSSLKKHIRRVNISKNLLPKFV